MAYWVFPSDSKHKLHIQKQKNCFYCIFIFVFLVWPNHVSDRCSALILAGGIWTFEIVTYPPNPLRLRAIPPHATCQHQSLTRHCIMPNTAPISACLPISLSKTFGGSGWQCVVFCDSCRGSKGELGLLGEKPSWIPSNNSACMCMAAQLCSNILFEFSIDIIMTLYWTFV